MIEFNLNWNVRFKVTAKGLSVLNSSARHLKPNRDGYYETQLWVFMELFGPHLSMGFNQPVETSIVLVSVVL
jgi:hypothetical protein